MPLKLHNTLTNKKNEFNPVDEKHIRMYVCGPTVYDEIHIGNARPLVVFDVLYRVLTKYYSDSKVTYVRNITDVDDKIIEKAEELGIPIQNLTNETIDSFHYITDTLNCLKPNVEPKATDHIGEMINIITALIKKMRIHSLHMMNWTKFYMLSLRKTLAPKILFIKGLMNWLLKESGVY